MIFERIFSSVQKVNRGRWGVTVRKRGKGKENLTKHTKMEVG